METIVYSTTLEWNREEGLGIQFTHFVAPALSPEVSLRPEVSEVPTSLRRTSLAVQSTASSVGASSEGDSVETFDDRTG